MPNYNLFSLASLDLSYHTAFGSPRTPALTEVAKALIVNLDRVSSMYLFPGRLLNISTHFARKWTEARNKLIGDVNITAQNLERYKEVRVKIVDEIDPFPPRNLESLDGGPGNRQWAREEGLLILDALVMKSGDFLSQAVEAMLSSMVVGAWTAFETLSGDLWEATVNVHPHGLAQLAGKKKKSDQEAKGDPGKMMPFSRLEQHHFNVSLVMGTLEREMKKVTFTKIEEIRGAYADAFGGLAPAVCDVLRDPALDCLSIVRNVIVHKAGLCDREYIDKSENRPSLPRLRPGSKLELDGQFVEQLVSPSIRCCVRLIKSVDDWLAASLATKAGLLAEAEGSGI